MTCPSTVGNVTSECANWYGSIIAHPDSIPTPDWFHTCSEFDFFSPPEVAFGIQETAHGEGYVGIMTFWNSPAGIDYREIIGVELTQPLTVDETYLVEFKVSSLEPYDSFLITNNIGFNFSTNSHYDSFNFPFNSSHFTIDSVIGVSSDWVQVSTEFTADSTYNFFHIGNFYDDLNTEVILENDLAQDGYYVIDDVRITPLLSNSDLTSASRHLEIYPNPTRTQLSIVLANEESIKLISILTLNGRKILSENRRAESSSATINTERLLNGAYLIEIETSKNKYYEVFIKM